MAKGTKRGYRRVEKKRVQNEEQSAFAQHRLELFKLANELCILTGAHVALIVFSPNNKVFSFGCPDVQSVIDKYENQTDHPPAGGHQAQEQSVQERLARELAIMEAKVESEKKRGKMLDRMIEARKGKNWWEAPIEDLELNQLEELLRANQALYDDISKELGKMPASRLNNDQAPTSMDGSQNATIPYLINKFSSLTAGGGSSKASPGFHFEMSGTGGVVQCEGSPRANFGASEMIASTSGSNSVDSFDSKGTKN